MPKRRKHCCFLCLCYDCPAETECSYTGTHGCPGHDPCPYDGDPASGKECPATLQSGFLDARVDARLEVDHAPGG